MKQKNYILKIIPLQPLPSQAPDFFLYFCNKNYPINRGSLVKINFNKKDIFGYVYDFRPLEETKLFIKKLDYQLKPIKEIISPKIIFTDIQEKLAFKISRIYNLSLAHAFYLFLKFYINVNNPSIDNHFLTADLKNQKQKTTQQKFSLEILTRLDWEKILTAIDKKKVLLIFPSKEECEIYYPKIKDKISDLIYLKNLKNFNNYLQEIISPEKKIFLGNKNIIFLPWQNLDLIIVFNQGSLFYKEFFKTPKINYLELIEDLAKLMNCRLIYIDHFLSLSLYLKFKNLPYPQLNFNNFENISDLLKLINNNQTNKIFILQKNLGQRLICLKCYYQFQCPQCHHYLTVFENNLFCSFCFKSQPLTNLCPQCQSSEYLSIKGIGAQFIKKLLINNHFHFYEINNENDLKKFKKIKNQNGSHYIVLGNWHVLNLETDNSFFINFDKGFFSENLFLKEIYLRLAYNLYKTSKNLFIHTHLNEEKLNEIKEGLIIESILKERQLNYLPPFCYQIKLIARLSDLQKLNYRLISLKEELKKRVKDLNLKQPILISGPFLERILKIKKRYQMYLTLKTKQRFNLKKLLNNITLFEELRFDDYDL